MNVLKYQTSILFVMFVWKIYATHIWKQCFLEDSLPQGLLKYVFTKHGLV